LDEHRLFNQKAEKKKVKRKRDDQEKRKSVLGSYGKKFSRELFEHTEKYNVILSPNQS